MTIKKKKNSRKPAPIKAADTPAPLPCKKQKKTAVAARKSRALIQSEQSGGEQMPAAFRGKMALSKARHVREEMARLYRDAVTGKINTQAAARLTFMLQQLAKVIETSDLEQKVQELLRITQEQQIRQLQ